MGENASINGAFDYYPYGSDLRSYIQGVDNNKYRFSQKEKDVETMYSYFGARYYDPDLGRWLSVDPLAGKYPGWSPYNYCADNPLRYTDPDGMEVRIYTGGIDKDGKKEFITYTSGMEYSGDNKFVADMIGILNKINSVEIGSTVLSDLISSKNAFSLLNQNSSGGEYSFEFVSAAGGGADIKAGSWNKFSEDTNILNVAHELFHGYQYEKTGLCSGAGSEVEAFLYAKGVLSGTSTMIVDFVGSKTSIGKKYSNAMNSLMWGFDDAAFKQAINSFRKGNPSEPNIYINSTIHSDFIPLIQNFYPLIR